MAEVYGNKPKKFTKEWWPYFWMYYKWHTLGTIFVLICIATFIVQCATKEKFDLYINYAGSGILQQDTLSELESSLEPEIEDADKNGKNNLFIRQYNFMNTPGSADSDYTIQTKHDLELSDKISYLYIYDIDEMSIILGETRCGAYDDVNNWLDADYKLTLENENAFNNINTYDICKAANGTKAIVPSGSVTNSETLENLDGISTEKVVYSADGRPIAVSLSGSSFLKKHGIISDGLYLALKAAPADNEKDSIKSAYNSSLKLAGLLLK